MDQIQRAVVLTFFIPLIISSGGNSGTQATTLVVRAMALQELSLKDWWTVMRREVAFGITLGTSLAAIGYLRMFIGARMGEQLGIEWGRISLVVGCSLLVVVLWGVTIGSMLPFVLRRLGADPAVSSTPFVATIVDVTGLMIYFSFAAILL
jgi:magnesium transporter